MKAKWLWVMMIASVFGTKAFAMNGKALAVVNYCRSMWYTGQDPDISRLIVTSISGTAATETDTILKGGRFYYPLWSFDGTRIALYKTGAGVCVMDADGGDLRTVAMTEDWANSNKTQMMAWPGADGGRWLYYHRPCHDNCFMEGSGEIWKVDVDDTTRKSLVCDYTKLANNSPEGVAGPWFDRFQLSADGKYCAVEALAAPVEVYGYVGGLLPHPFPPPDCDPRASTPACTEAGQCHFYGDCNGALSCSGKLFYHFSGAHGGFYANYWDHEANTITPWYPVGTEGAWKSCGMNYDMLPLVTVGPTTGACVIYPRGACNSDQIVTILIGWQYGAEYPLCGNNLMIVNWKDREAVWATLNPEPPHPNGWVPDGTHYWYAEPGDFRLDEGPEGCYEAIDGSWVEVPGAPAVAARETLRRTQVSRRLSGSVALYDLRGARIGAFDAPEVTQGTCGIRRICVGTSAAGGGAGRAVLVAPGFSAK